MGTNLSCVADDGLAVNATVAGVGTPVILLPGGIDYTGRGWDKAASLLAHRRRVVRFVRRFYRPELGDPFRWNLTDEARDVAALAAQLGGAVALLGHSSGGVLALECLVRDPTLYGSAVVFEPPVVLDHPLGGPALARARTDLAGGHPGRSMATFFHDVVGLPRWSSWLAAASLVMVPAYRRRIPGQLADLAAIDGLGDRRSAYRAIDSPALGIWGTASPAHLAERTRALVQTIPHMQAWQVDGNHAAAQQHSREVADRIMVFLNSLPESRPQ